MKKILWVKCGWSEYYRGGPVDGNFGWLNEHRGQEEEGRGHEALNLCQTLTEPIIAMSRHRQGIMLPGTKSTPVGRSYAWLKIQSTKGSMSLAGMRTQR